MNIEEIKKILPHRDPFLMVDQIIEMVPGEKAVGIKKLTGNEAYFAGHFPGYPVMPGVLMIETIAQVGACALLSLDRYKEHLIFLAGVDNARFRKQAFPGDILTISAELIKIKAGIGKGRGRILSGDSLICSADFLFGISKV